MICIFRFVRKTEGFARFENRIKSHTIRNSGEYRLLVISPEWESERKEFQIRDYK